MTTAQNQAGFDPRELTEKVIALGEDWADKDAAASSLEETKKTVLAKIMTDLLEKAKSDGKKGLSISMAESLALSDPGYELHLDLMINARKEAHKAKVRYDMGKMQLELMRTLQATLRSEMRYTSGQT